MTDEKQKAREWLRTNCHGGPAFGSAYHGVWYVPAQDALELEEILSAYGAQCRREALEAACKRLCTYCHDDTPHVHDLVCPAYEIRKLLAELDRVEASQ